MRSLVVVGWRRTVACTRIAEWRCHASHYGMTGSRSQGIGYAVGATEPRRATCERSRSMPTNLRYLGLDVHAETIAVAVAERDGEVRPLGILPHRPDAVTKLIRKLGPREHLRACYEAGPCGYVLYWQLTKLGVHCDVVAPTLVPTKPGDRVKTDRRDAAKLARCYRAGDLTPVWVPDAAHEALRDLVRAREAAKGDQLRARHRLGKFLLRRGIRPPAGVNPWTERHRRWLDTVQFEAPAQQATLGDYLQEVDHAAARLERLEQALDEAVQAAPASLRAVIAALQTLRGIRQVTAATIVCEVGPLSRFTHPRQLMGYSGTVPSEHSSGAAIHRGGITKTGNAHLRRVLVEAAWAYRFPPRCGKALRTRQRGQPDTITAIAWKAQHRLNTRYRRLLGRGKPTAQVVTAVARELVGFIWAIGVATERASTAAAAA